VKPRTDSETPKSKLCVPIVADTVERMVADAHAAIDRGAEMVELRLDYLGALDAATAQRLVTQVKKIPVEVIATCRMAVEGGRYAGDERVRADVLAAAARAGADYVDVEHRAWGTEAFQQSGLAAILRTPADVRGVTDPPARLILSAHDFERTPTHLPESFGKIARESCDVVKVACQANRITDSLAMLDALRGSAASRPTIALSMGEAGLMTRTLAGKFGAMLTFAALTEGSESAPGQVTVAQMRDLYRWSAVGPETQVYGVIGCPVAHSMSPAILNAAFGAAGHDGVYLPLRVEPAYEELAAFLDGCLARPWLNVRGFSVTIPHKQNLLRYVSQRGGEIEPLAARIGAANTLCIEVSRREDNTDTRVAAYNTDYRGAMDALLAGMGQPESALNDARVVVLGAGGAARAIVAGLRDAGARVTICNRTAAKANALADEFEAETHPWDRRGRLEADVIVHCTSIGMWPDTDATPLPDVDLPSRTVVFDTIYNPIETRLLREAGRCGCTTIDGLAMFVNQAAAQFKLWTGRPAPVEAMRKVALERLKR